LRNPTLKARHWEEIEAVLETQFTPEEPLTLGRLVQIDAFYFAEELEEIAGKASSEAGLEAILKKVCVTIMHRHNQSWTCVGSIGGLGRVGFGSDSTNEIFWCKLVTKISAFLLLLLPVNIITSSFFLFCRTYLFCSCPRASSEAVLEGMLKKVSFTTGGSRNWWHGDDPSLFFSALPFSKPAVFSILPHMPFGCSVSLEFPRTRPQLCFLACLLQISHTFLLCLYTVARFTVIQCLRFVHNPGCIINCVLQWRIQEMVVGK